MGDRLVDYYRNHRARLSMALILAGIIRCFGAVEPYVTLAIPGHAIPFAHAGLVVGVVVLARTMLFVLPSKVFSVALIRCFREPAWILVGLAVRARYSARAPTTDAGSRCR